MTGGDPGVIIRRARRFDVVLPAAIRVGDAHAELVRFGPRAGDRSGWVEGDLIDIGSAGAGFMGATFLPRGTEVVLRVFRLGDRDGDPLIELQGRVTRVVMTDRRPAYLVGVAFDASDDAKRAQVEDLVAQFGGDGPEERPDG